MLSQETIKKLNTSSEGQELKQYLHETINSLSSEPITHKRDKDIALEYLSRIRAIKKLEEILQGLIYQEAPPREKPEVY